MIIHFFKWQSFKNNFYKKNYNFYIILNICYLFCLKWVDKFFFVKISSSHIIMRLFFTLNHTSNFSRCETPDTTNFHVPSTGFILLSINRYSELYQTLKTSSVNQFKSDYNYRLLLFALFNTEFEKINYFTFCQVRPVC